MEVMVLIVAIFIALIIKMEHDKVTAHRKLMYKLNKEWGDVPKEEFSPQKLESMYAYYNAVKREKGDVDDITWHDLDMNQIFFTVNNTRSAAGEEVLFSMLHQPEFDPETLEERERLIQFFSNHKEERQKVQEILSRMGKMKELSVYEYMNRLNILERENNFYHIFLIISLFIGIGTVFLSPIVGFLLTTFCVVNNIIQYYKRKMNIEKYFQVVSYIIRLVDSARELSDCNIKEISKYTDTLRSDYKIYAKFVKGSWLVTSRNPSGSLADMFLDYLRMFFHLDLMKFNTMMKVFETKNYEMNEMFEIMGKLDSFIAIASFRELMVEYCIPNLTLQDKPSINTENIYHPMINEPVKNSIKEVKSVLITGSNASGKSTFIKTLAINAILAQTIHTVMADSYDASYFKVASSMALQDNLYNKESYYIVEIKSLKRIIDMLEDKIPMLCFVDEVLRGTNTLERIAASSRILLSLAKGNAICFAATHDIELTHILEKFYSNYHFQEQVVEDDVLFDYVLQEGRAVSKNAIKLLKIMGYEDYIIEDATNSANEFLETGEWKAIKE
jgi:DNA mismatch repair ATPase MutS